MLVRPVLSYCAIGRTVLRMSSAASGVSNIEVFSTATRCAKDINVCPITTSSQCECESNDSLSLSVSLS